MLSSKRFEEDESVQAINLLSSASSVDDLVRAGTRWAHATGFENWVFCIGAPAPPRLIGHLPDAFVDAGIEAREVFTAVLALGERHQGPVTWSPASSAIPCSSATEKQHQQLAGLRALGFSSGIAAPIHSPEGRLACMFVATNTGPVDADALRKRELMVAAFSFYFQQAVLGVLGESCFAPQHATLVARELECLRWANSGKTSDEIADILRLSPSTVNFHITNAARKFGVKGRQQAIQHASKLHLL